MKHVAVIDIGKTNAKLALVDLTDMSELAVLTRPNAVLPGPPWPHFDLDGHWEFLLDGLTQFHANHGVDAICSTTHGASIVLLDEMGNLAAPMLDYEHTGPDAFAERYDAIRPDFGETGSPRSSMGLNVGAQLHYMFETCPGLRERTSYVMTYPQYWGYRLTGVIASEVTSLGCHTDLWDPYAKQPSSAWKTLGIEGRLAPRMLARDILGPILSDVADRCGLPTETPVYCGIHDSNASLLPYLLGKEPPFSVVSTGTWVIIMTIGGDAVQLDPERDTLVNVNAFADPVPSAKFMGGREYDIVSAGQGCAPSDEVMQFVLDNSVMLMPAVIPEIGPYRGKSSQWIGDEPAVGSPERSAALAYYLALVTAEGLRQTGHRGDVVVEGPFAKNDAFLAMLSAAADALVFASLGSTGTSQGCALLAMPEASFNLPDMPRLDRRRDQALLAYANAWRAQADL